MNAKKAKKLPPGIIVHLPSEATGNQYVAEVPSLTGCRAWGKTREEALDKLSRMAGNYIRSIQSDITGRIRENTTEPSNQRELQKQPGNLETNQRTIPKSKEPAHRFSSIGTIGIVDFSRDGKYAVLPGNITGDDYQPDASVVEILTGKITPLFGRSQPHSVVSVAISSKGDFVLASYDITGLLCWDVKNMVLHDYLGATSNTYQDPLVYMVFSPDDKYFAYHLTYNISLHNTLSGEYIRGFHGNRSHYNQMAFSHDGNNLFVACADGMIRYDVTGRKEPMLFADDKEIGAVSIFPGDQKLVTLEGNGTITVWDAPSGKEISHWLHSKSPQNLSDRLSVEEVEQAGWFVDKSEVNYKLLLPYVSLRSIAVSEDGKRILSGCGDNYMRLWNLEGKEICEYQHDSRVVKVAFQQDGQLALSACWDGSIFLWELPTP